MLQRIADKCRELKDHDPNREMFEYMKLYAANHRMWEKGIKEYVYCDSMSFKPKAGKLNEKYMSIRNKVFNKF